ncbi:MAG: hypothetical protein H7832_12715 [Magnetococcus sp. DMHC-6]
MKKLFFVRPMESLYFGPPRSFSAGEAHHGHSLFPPTPFAFQGMVRSQLLRAVHDPSLDLDDWSEKAIEERERLIGTPDRLPADWQLSGPLPALLERSEETEELLVVPWVPTPQFILGSKELPLHARLTSSDHSSLTDMNETYRDYLLLGRPDRHNGRPLGGWIGPQNLFFALAGEGNGSWNMGYWNKPLPPFVKEETRPGVALDADHGRVKTGMLYSLLTLRFADQSGFFGELDGDLAVRIPQDALTTGFGTAGHKGRAVAFEPVEEMHPQWLKLLQGEHLPPEVTTEEDAFFWLLTLTPVWLEDVFKPRLNVVLPQDVRVQFRGAMTGDPIALGGFQMNGQASRSNKLYIPAGSAWLFQLRGGDLISRRRALSMLHNAHIIGSKQEEARFGFGYTLVGMGPSRPEVN